MGLCVSSMPMPADATPEQVAHIKDLDKGITKKAVQKNIQDQQIAKLLLLGAGESGKSTLFRQMTKLFGKGFNGEQRLAFIAAIHQQIREAAVLLIKEQKTHFAKDEKFQFSEEAEKAAERILAYGKDEKLTIEEGNLYKLLWSDPGFRATFDNRRTVLVPESIAYFFNEIDRVVDERYLPTDEDLILMRIRTTGMIKEEFQIENLRFTLHDVGGQRSERRKWLNMFDGVTAVLYVIAISEYDMVCFEDEKTNRIVESLEVFDETFNKKNFLTTPIILFLNKRDLFEKKFPKVPIETYFPEWKGSTKEQAYDFFREKFVNRLQVKRDVFTHVTNATDSDNCLKVFHAVQHIIVKLQLGESGFL
eukprot:TRINITY_DN3524_c0_g1_i1.p1 TRINITY_DN3524_c0_g1~~TRINITY_DN3524_c0_g1_i1.p1  ORF type:complete len:363 (+),score=107.54 TRINITY_DN3524_c0_g1_i1:234-1322(+)